MRFAPFDQKFNEVFRHHQFFHVFIIFWVVMSHNACRYIYISKMEKQTLLLGITYDVYMKKKEIFIVYGYYVVAIYDENICFSSL